MKDWFKIPNSVLVPNVKLGAEYCYLSSSNGFNNEVWGQIVTNIYVTSLSLTFTLFWSVIFTKTHYNYYNLEYNYSNLWFAKNMNL